MVNFFNKIKANWYREGGYRQILVLSFPLIMSTGSWSILHFVDRMFLTWYSSDAIAASVPAGILNFTFVSLFMGTANYVNTFISQYYGAKKYKMIGLCLWQGIFISIVGGIIILFFAPLSPYLFQFFGHEAGIQKLEIIYFKVLCFGSIGPILSSTMSGFFAGRGQNWPIMWVNLFATGVNLILDYILIFGNWGFPELGVFGAALATIIAGFFSIAAYCFLIFRPKIDRVYHTVRGFKFDPALIKRILFFGFPNGVHFCLDMIGFAIFILILGKLGKVELAATNIAFNINGLAFMPMIGIGMAVSMSVGQNIGKNNIPMAQRSIFSGFTVTLIYMGTIASLYIFVPNLFLMPFEANALAEEFIEIKELTLILLRFIAVYCLFDTLNIIFASAIKGAGDTRFVMFLGIGLSFGLLVIPTALAVVVFKANLFVAWTISTTYISVLGLTFLLRFLSGKWKSMKVIESTPHQIPVNYPEVPSTESDI